MPSFLWKLLRFFLFRLDPELAHRFTVKMIRWGAWWSPKALRIVSGSPSTPVISQLPRVFGMTFRSRVGLAAGFDKDGELLQALPHLGFGFVEIGTITPLPQPGNPRPRLFRSPENQALFNCMGFNGAGAEEVSRRISRVRGKLPEHFRVGINLGKNKDTALVNAASDYRKAAIFFRDLADYIVINVSSPNTPGLRSLQTVEALRPIVDQVADVTSNWSTKPPLLLKLAPEIVGEDLNSLVSAFESPSLGSQIGGWIFTNTLAGTLKVVRTFVSGGWSGGPLSEKSRLSLSQARSKSRLPIISVGGILTANEAIERRKSGADLVQIYTGWVYGGPEFPSRVAEAIMKYDLANY